MTTLDIDKHVVVVRESGTGKLKHPTLRDLVSALDHTPLKGTPGPDPRIEGIQREVSSLAERISSLGNAGPQSDPRIDDLIGRVVFIEEALKSLVIRALNEAET